MLQPSLDLGTNMRKKNGSNQKLKVPFWPVQCQWMQEHWGSYKVFYVNGEIDLIFNFNQMYFLNFHLKAQLPLDVILTDPCMFACFFLSLLLAVTSSPVYRCCQWSSSDSVTQTQTQDLPGCQNCCEHNAK